MIRRPPRSTLFPYRRSSDLGVQDRQERREHRLGRAAADGHVPLGIDVHTVELRVLRSEEHTSELQSRLHLVCRLLLEKKKETPLEIFHASTHNRRTLDPCVH